jgi:hypothetical protein
MRKLVLLFSFFLLTAPTWAQSPATWWLNRATEKILSTTVNPNAPLQLSASRLEYAPFQIAIVADSTERTFDAPTLNYNQEYFSIVWYEQFFVPILKEPSIREIFSDALITGEAFIPDGLTPLADSFTVPANRLGALWADVYINANTPAGDYPIEVTFNGTTQTATLTVYAVDMPASGGVQIMIPTKKVDNVPFYGGDDEDGFLRSLNRMMLDHNITPGTLTGEPAYDEQENRWFFSSFNEDLDALPEGANFYAPMPYNRDWEEYYILDPNGAPYTITDFSDEDFVTALDLYFQHLAEYLDSRGRLQGALAYPIDETQWVADEPDHNGQAGYEHLAQWTEIIRRHGIRVTASRVSPAPYAPDWLPSDQLTDDTHVHIDLLDAGIEPYTQWQSVEGNSSSVYLNHYGDMIELPASIHRAVTWHMFGRGIRQVTGYEAMDWFTDDWELIDPFNQIEDLSPKFGGYGVGALFYPGPNPSTRVKILREGVEDSRLLDLYAAQFGLEVAQQFALCLTPEGMSYQNPPADLFENAHVALLRAISSNTAVDTSLCQPTPQYSDALVVSSFETNIMQGGEWTIENVDFEVVTSLWDGTSAYQITYKQADSYVSLWLNGMDWSAYDTVLIDIANPTPYYAEFDFALGDPNNYILLRPGVNNIAPNSQITLELPLVVPSNEQFDWRTVMYLELFANTDIEREDGNNDQQVYFIGERTLIFDNIRLVRKQ